MADEIKTPEIGENQDAQKPDLEQKPDDGKGTPEQQLARMQDALSKANHEAAKYRKQVEALEKASKEREDAELSEMDKLKRQLEDAKGELSKVKTDALKRETAEKVGLPAAFALRIQGETPEDMEIDAKALLEAIQKPKPKGTGNPTNPNAEETQGGKGETEAERRKRLLG